MATGGRRYCLHLAQSDKPIVAVTAMATGGRWRLVECVQNLHYKKGLLLGLLWNVHILTQAAKTHVILESGLAGLLLMSVFGMAGQRSQLHKFENGLRVAAGCGLWRYSFLIT